MAPPMTRRSELSDSQLDAFARVTVIEQIGLTARFGLVVGCVVGLAYFAKESVVALAGKSTDANVFVSFLSHVEVNVAIAWTLAAGGVMYGMAERKLRQKSVKKMHRQIRELELLVDPKRSSSTLTEVGDTNPEDK